ncbi:hypothetical protein [Nocardia sp. NPDC058480]|uniref:hypothetical protein n=1 Tax=unclassified Nocardia TaxID=2637762 RepID=UPI00365CD678
MRKPWGDFGVDEWLWTQIRNPRPSLVTPVPVVDLPGCAAGEVSSRRWLNWRQANAVSAFAVGLTREIVTALGQEGITPTETWLHQEARAISWGGRRRMCDPHGDYNGFTVVTSVKFPKYSLSSYKLDSIIVPPIYTRYPISETCTGHIDSSIPGPYGFRTGVGFPLHGKRYDLLCIGSAGYYYRYRGSGAYPGRYIGNWPLDPADEREPLVYPDKPRTTMPARRHIPAIAEYTLAEVTRWSEFLGCQLGDATAGWQLDFRDEPTVKGYETYVISAPVTLTLTEAEIGQRALPHTAVSAPLNGVSREPRPGSHRRLPLVTFTVFNGLRADINDRDTPGQFVLTVASNGYRAGVDQSSLPPKPLKKG